MSKRADLSPKKPRRALSSSNGLNASVGNAPSASTSSSTSWLRLCFGVKCLPPHSTHNLPDATDGTGPTYTGHYAESTTFNSNELGGTFTEVGNGVSKV